MVIMGLPAIEILQRNTTAQDEAGAEHSSISSGTKGDSEPVETDLSTGDAKGANQ